MGNKVRSSGPPFPWGIRSRSQTILPPGSSSVKGYGRESRVHCKPLDYKLLGIQDNAMLCMLAPTSEKKVKIVFSMPLWNRKAPSWSPQGRYLAFEAFRDERNEVYIFDQKSRKVRKLTNGELGSHSPSWSPGGKRIAVTTGIKTKAWIEIYDLNGKVLDTFRGRARFLGYPSWSPDGKKLCAVEQDKSRKGRLVILDLKSKKLVRK